MHTMFPYSVIIPKSHSGSEISRMAWCAEYVGVDEINWSWDFIVIDSVICIVYFFNYAEDVVAFKLRCA